MALTIGVTQESAPGETRVSATPATVRQLIGLGYEVVLSPGAGVRSSFADADYVTAGATTGNAYGADIVFAVNAPTPDEISLLRAGATLVSLVAPALHPELLEAFAARGVTVLAMDAVPRVSRAQSLDVLSSMANIAGYRAVVEAAHLFGRFFAGQVTAAGKVPPAKVLVAGAGVAGLAAIGAANRLGAVVRATDPRPEVADQVESLGGTFLTVDVESVMGTDGYAKATSEDYNRRAAEIYSEQAADVDIIITTALIPGRPAPRLITAADVASMRSGSVVVDMAAAAGGNVEGSVAGEAVVTAGGVTILGYSDLAARLPTQASQLYGTNLVNLMKLLTPGKDGELVLDWDDTVQRSITVVRGHEVTWPPPPVAVSAAPAAPVLPVPDAVAARAPWPYKLPAIALATAVLLFFVVAYAPAQLSGNITVFVLAVVIGYYVIGHVHHALHTPLMSVTNAISGVVVVGAVLQIGHGDATITTLSFVAILLAGINIFAGFTVTRRMLGMFSKGDH